MPLYEYRCGDCQHQFEKLVRASSPAPACPSCGGDHLERQYSTFSAQMGAAKSGGVQPCAPAPAGMCGMCGVPGSCSRN